MPLEHPSYRDNLERIVERYPGVEMLSIKQVIEFTGISRNAVMRRFIFRDKYISVASLARQMST